MADIGMKDLLEAGVHFGHQTRRWNPQDEEVHLHGAERHLHHRPAEDAQVRSRRRATAILEGRCAAAGTSSSSARRSRPRTSIAEESTRCGMFYVTERWLGGMLTNFKTIKTSITPLQGARPDGRGRHLREALEEGGLAPSARSGPGSKIFTGHQGDDGAAVGRLRRRHQEGEDRGGRGEPPRASRSSAWWTRTATPTSSTSRCRATTTRFARSGSSRGSSATPCSPRGRRRRRARIWPPRAPWPRRRRPPW